jgi:hypothetical protein
VVKGDPLRLAYRPHLPSQGLAINMLSPPPVPAGKETCSAYRTSRSASNACTSLPSTSGKK